MGASGISGRVSPESFLDISERVAIIPFAVVNAIESKGASDDK